jgi:hypothetical protein
MGSSEKVCQKYRIFHLANAWIHGCKDLILLSIAGLFPYLNNGTQNNVALKTDHYGSKQYCHRFIEIF